MAMPEKVREIINKLNDYTQTRNEKLIIGRYTLEEIKQARYHYKNDNSKLPNLIPAFDDIIKRLEDICTDRKRKKEKWFDRLIGFIFAIILFIITAYLRSCLKLWME